MRITGSLEHAFDCLHHPLDRTVALWVMWAASDLSKSIRSSELRELVRRKLWSVVAADYLWNPVSTEDRF